MARHKGYNGSVEVGAAVVGEIESFDIELSVNELDADVMGTDWSEVESGKKSAKGSINVLRDPDDAGQIALVVGDKVSLTLYPEGDATGLTKIDGSFLITSKGLSVGAGDLVKTAYNIRNAGAVTETAVA